MTGWTDVFLGVIAVTTLITAIIQIAVLVIAGRLVVRLMRLTDRVEQEIKPVFRHLDSIGRDAVRAASVAAAQVDRADGVFADFTTRVVHAMDNVERAANAPVREGAAIVAGFKAAMNALRDFRTGRARSRSEDENALFI